MNSPSSSFSILQLYYPHVSKLLDFLLFTIRDADRETFVENLNNVSDSKTYKHYKELLNNAYVGCSLDAALPGRVSLDTMEDDMGSVRLKRP